MDELTLRLECLRLACTSRSGSVTDQAETFLRWVLDGGRLDAMPSTDIYQKVENSELERLGLKSPAKPTLKLPDAARRT